MTLLFSSQDNPGPHGQRFASATVRKSFRKNSNLNGFLTKSPPSVGPSLFGWGRGMARPWLTNVNEVLPPRFADQPGGAAPADNQSQAQPC